MEGVGGATASRTIAPSAWRAFGRADERPYRRRPSDVARLVVATVLLVASARHVGAAHPVERDLARFFADLPPGFDGVFRSLLALGTLWGVIARHRRRAAPAATAARPRARRRRHPRLGRRARRRVPRRQRHRRRRAPRCARQLTHAGRYPTVHLAVLGAVLLTAAPFLGRPLRRAGTLLLTLLVLGALYRELGSPERGVRGPGDRVGQRRRHAPPRRVTCRAADHRSGGSRARRSSASPTDGVELAPEQAVGFTRMLATTDDGERLPVRVYGRDAAETRFGAKLWRTVAYKDSGPTLTFTRLQQVEHEALCMLRARDAGVAVPDLVAVGVAGPSAAVLVTRTPELVAAVHTAGDVRDAWSGARSRCGPRGSPTVRSTNAHLGVTTDGSRGHGVLVHAFSVASVSASPDAPRHRRRATARHHARSPPTRRPRSPSRSTSPDPTSSTGRFRCSSSRHSRRGNDARCAASTRSCSTS